MKKIAAVLLCCILLALLSGCRGRTSPGSGDYLVGESYPDAEKYQTGAFTYDGDSVHLVEVYWRSGGVEIIQRDEGELTVSESGGAMDADISMHYLLEDGVLKIRFCASGAKVRIQPSEKRLTLAVPKGIDLSIHTTAAPIQAETLTQKNILLSAHSGDMTLGNLDAADINLSSSAGAISAESLSAQMLTCRTSSGNVRVENLTADTAKVETTSGKLSLGLLSAGNVEILTSSGDVALRLPAGGAALAYSTACGALRSDAAYQRRGDLYVFGDEESGISVATTSGNLSITGWTEEPSQ